MAQTLVAAVVGGPFSFQPGCPTPAAAALASGGPGQASEFRVQALAGYPNNAKVAVCSCGVCAVGPNFDSTSLANVAHNVPPYGGTASTPHTWVFQILDPPAPSAGPNVLPPPLRPFVFAM